MASPNEFNQQVQKIQSVEMVGGGFRDSLQKIKDKVKGKVTGLKERKKPKSYDDGSSIRSSGSDTDGGEKSHEKSDDGMKRSKTDKNNVIQLTGTGLKKTAKLVKLAAISVVSIATFCQAIVILIVIITIIVFIVMLVMYYRPIIPLISHSYDYDKFMDDEYYPDLISSLKVIKEHTFRFGRKIMTGESSKIVTPGAYPGSETINKVQAAAVKLLEVGDLQLQRNLHLYFTHQMCVTKRGETPYNFFCKSSFCTDPEFRKSASSPELISKIAVQWDEEKVAAFEENVVKPVHILREGCKNISIKAFESADDMMNKEWYQVDSLTAFTWVAAIHKLRIFLDNYHDQISLSAMSRVNDTFSINIWIIFYTPFIKDIFQHHIPAIWRNLNKIRIQLYTIWDAGFKWLGRWIINMPCRIIAKAQGEQANNCNANFLLL